MVKITSFSDYFLIKAAADYSYKMSQFDLYDDPIFAMKLAMQKDFTNRFQPILIENKPIMRKDEIIQLRYLLCEDRKSGEYALIYQGSDYDFEALLSGQDKDWSYNLSSIAQLPLENYDLAKKEFKYLKEELGYNITAVAGNSLGGGYALNLAADYPNLRIIGLNPAPQTFKSKYIKTAYTSIIVTNTDLLSRLISLDISRLETDFENVLNLSKQEKLKRIYGFKPTIINRSIYYMDKSKVMSAHVGALINYREYAKNFFLANKVYYTSKIALNGKSFLDFSKYLLKLPLDSFEKLEYIDFVDNYIIPNLIEYAQNQVINYRSFPTIAEFILYDNSTLNLINAQGINKHNRNFKIVDKKEFINNVLVNLSNYQTTTSFIFNDNEYLLAESQYETDKSLHRRTFFTQNFNMNTNVDLSVLKHLSYIPVAGIIKLTSLIEHNRKILKQLLSALNSDYFEVNSDFLKPELNRKYNNLYTELNKTLKALTKSIIANIKIVVNNIEYLSISLNVKKQADTSEFKNIQELSIKSNLEAFLAYDNLIEKQFEEVYNYIVEYSYKIEASIDEIVLLTDEIIAQMLHKYAESKAEKHVLKLREQLSGIDEKLDFETFLKLLISDFKYDFNAFLLRDSVGMHIKNNLQQYLEVNDNLIAYLLNLKHYTENNYSSQHYYLIKKDINKILADIKLLNELLQKLF